MQRYLVTCRQIGAFDSRKSTGVAIRDGWTRGGLPATGRSGEPHVTQSEMSDALAEPQNPHVRCAVVEGDMRRGVGIADEGA